MMRKLLMLVPIGLAACGPAGVTDEEPVDRAVAAITSCSSDGELGPLIPFHKDAIHAGFIGGARGGPKLLLWMRPSEYRGTDLVDPSVGPIGQLRSSTFLPLVYDGFGFSNLLDGSVRSRIKADIPRDNALIFDLSHPDAFKNSGKYLPQDLTEADFAMNAAAFSDAGTSRGLHYNVFCAGNDALADGSWVVVGGHDKGGNNGIRKINVFNPRTMSWKRRPVPPVKADFLADPDGLDLPHADPRNEANTDPPHSSDMKYQRWYPTTVTLPDNRVLILSGTDQDTSNPATASSTKVRIATPEVYDPRTDTVVALENAQKLLPMYPRSFVVQTGPRPNDWKVAVVTEVQPPLPTDVRPFDPWDYNGNTYLFDVQAALRDKNRSVPAENHWELVATALHSHEGSASAAIFATDFWGRARSQKVAVFGGASTDGSTAAVEMIDFAHDNPTWSHVADLAHPASENNAVVLPDGNVVIVGGRAGRGGSEVLTYEVQMFEPSSGTLRTMVQTVIPRHDHSTALLTHDGSVLIMGGNREEIVPGDTAAGVPVGQIYKPPYLLKGARPRIERSPSEVDYGDWFHVRATASHKKKIESVVIVRMSPVTHNWSWGNRLVKLAFHRTGKHRLSIRAPSHLGAAPPGYYMLFVLDEDGVPSVAKEIRLGGDRECD